MTKQLSPWISYPIVFGFVSLLLAFFYNDMQRPWHQQFFKTFSLNSLSFTPPPDPPKQSGSDFARSPESPAPNSDSNVGGLGTDPEPTPSIASRIITYSLEGNWDIKASITYRRPDGSTFLTVYSLRLMVQKDPPNSGAISGGTASLKILALTKNGNKFTIQTESIMFAGAILMQGELTNSTTMQGTCRFDFTPEASHPVTTNFVGHKVEQFNIQDKK